MSTDDAATPANYHVAIDTGGTFTDVAIRRPDGSMFVWKVSSTPSAPDDGVIDGLLSGLAEIDVSPSAVGHFVHGTTVATNTVITRTGARVGLVTTAGFADLLGIADQTRPSLYDQTARRTTPLVDRTHTWEVVERTGAQGEEVTALDLESLADLIEPIAAVGLDVVVVSFINAYAQPHNERTVAKYLADHGVAESVFAATDITAEMREYERTSTAVINGYVQPKIAGYIDQLTRRSREAGVPEDLWVMQSNGGLLSPSVAQEQSARTVLSGLAGGVVGAGNWATQLGLDNVVSFDIGGTSTDIALIRNGRPDEVNSGDVDGLPLRMPMVDVHTIGAGGGSIAWTDNGGGLRVGPQSAGAVPGPICYSRGGTEITVTDAHAVLGRLGTSLLGGRLALDVDAARARVAQFSDELGLGVEQTSIGILRVINANMARGVRKVSVERGVDLRQCDLMAFGGAGPLHGADLVSELGMRSAVVPPMPGIASAVGMLDAPIRHDFSATAFAREQADLEGVDRVLTELHGRGDTAVGENRQRTNFLSTVDARYVGQSYELTIPYSHDFTSIRKAFDAAHSERYGFDDIDADFEIVTARLTAVVAPTAPLQGSDAEHPFIGNPQAAETRQVYFGESWYETPIYARTSLSNGVELVGPLIIEQFDSTVVVGPTQQCRTDRHGFLHITSKVPS